MKLRLTLRYRPENSSDCVFTILLLAALSMLLFGLVSSPPKEILLGMVEILTQPAALITDYIGLAGMGAAFCNAGMVMAASVLLLRFLKLPFTGMSVSCCFLMGGFALFGKNLVNVIPILMGVEFYALYRRERFAQYAYIALFGTTLSPIVTEMGLMARHWPAFPRMVFPLFIGALIGFVLPAIAAYTMRLHQGYNLYNVGFAAGLVGLVLVSVLRSFGNDFRARLVWSRGNDLRLGIYLALLFGGMALAGWLYNGRSFQGLRRLTRHSGRSIADFIVMDGLPTTLLNMGIVGLFATFYVLIVGGDLNGPTIGGIFTIAGFGSFGKHMRNIVWVMLGVVLSSQYMTWSLSDPSVLLAALFSTGLAPIAGHFGPFWGIVAGALHSSVVLNVGVLYGGLNLYNNGFSAGLVCIVLLPLIQALRREKDDE